MTETAQSLLSKSRREMDDVFRASPPGPLPTGRSRGTAILLPGSGLDRPVRGLIRLLFWRGKVFTTDAGGTWLRNLIGPFSTPLFRADVYEDGSWFADGPAVILDYSNSSFLVRRIRDEIRQVRPGLYLGQVFWGRRRIALFLLELPHMAAGHGASGESVSQPARVVADVRAPAVEASAEPAPEPASEPALQRPEEPGQEEPAKEEAPKAESANTVAAEAPKRGPTSP